MKLGNSIGHESLLSRDDWKARQGFVDLKSKTNEQLEELIERQDKLLQNRAFIAKLPDKGEKIILFKSTLEGELKKRQENYVNTCQLLSNLTINDVPDEIEWSEGNTNKTQEDLDSDDESDSEVDPLRLIASHSGTAKGKTVIVKSNECNSEKTFYVEKFCEKYGQVTKTQERFKPNQLKDNNKNLFAVSAEKVRQRLGDKWEVTEATPPVPVFKDTVTISLSESLKLQKEQAERLKELERKNATERLIKSMSVKMGEKLPVSNISKYRTSENAFDETAGEGEEDEVHDSEGEDRGVAVYFPQENDDPDS